MQASVREVWEETGVRAEFRSVVSIRELIEWKFGKPDFYFLCKMKSLDDAI